MAFVRELLGRPVADVSGKQIGTLADLIATTRNPIAHPLIVAMAVNCGNCQLLIPVSTATVLIAPAIPLKFRLKISRPTRLPKRICSWRATCWTSP